MSQCDHNFVIVYRRRWQNFFCKTYWLRCCRCNFEDGPYPTITSAWYAQGKGASGE